MLFQMIFLNSSNGLSFLTVKSNKNLFGFMMRRNLFKKKNERNRWMGIHEYNSAAECCAIDEETHLEPEIGELTLILFRMCLIKILIFFFVVIIRQRFMWKWIKNIAQYVVCVIFFNFSILSKLQQNQSQRER